jgi:hypothetical protein
MEVAIDVGNRRKKRQQERLGSCVPLSGSMLPLKMPFFSTTNQKKKMNALRQENS